MLGVVWLCVPSRDWDFFVDLMWKMNLFRFWISLLYWTACIPLCFIAGYADTRGLLVLNLQRTIPRYVAWAELKVSTEHPDQLEAIAIRFEPIAMASNLLAMASNLLAMAFNLMAMASSKVSREITISCEVSKRLQVSRWGTAICLPPFGRS